MTEDKLHAQLIKQLQEENERLKKLVFESQPMRGGAIRRLFSKEKGHGWGGATDYEAWLRTLEYSELYTLLGLYTGGVDALRFRRRFVQHEMERRNLHSSYGKHSIEYLTENSKGLK